MIKDQRFKDNICHLFTKKYTIFFYLFVVFGGIESKEEIAAVVSNKNEEGILLSQEEWWANTECSSQGCPIQNPYTSWNDSNITYTNDTSLIQNSVLHYGSFCGPGPKLMLACRPPIDPVDDVDRICMMHDIEWCRCYENRLEPIVHNKPHPLILSTRFITLPPPIYRRLYDEAFRDCIGSADEKLLKDMDALESEGRLPAWWNKWTRRKFHTFLSAFRKSVARDKQMRLKQMEIFEKKQDREKISLAKKIRINSDKKVFQSFYASLKSSNRKMFSSLSSLFSSNSGRGDGSYDKFISTDDLMSSPLVLPSSGSSKGRRPALKQSIIKSNSRTTSGSSPPSSPSSLPVLDDTDEQLTKKLSSNHMLSPKKDSKNIEIELDDFENKVKPMAAMKRSSFKVRATDVTTDDTTTHDTTFITDNTITHEKFECDEEEFEYHTILADTNLEQPISSIDYKMLEEEEIEAWGASSQSNDKLDNYFLLLDDIHDENLSKEEEKKNANQLLNEVTDVNAGHSLFHEADRVLSRDNIEEKKQQEELISFAKKNEKSLPTTNDDDLLNNDDDEIIKNDIFDIRNSMDNQKDIESSERRDKKKVLFKSNLKQLPRHHAMP